jgi:predicted metal-dependent TIM-barrel fold hydrolase
MVLEQGFWAGITLHPHATASPQRAIDMIERFGPDRICVASGCDGGPSTPTAVARFALAMRRRGHPDALIRRIVYENPAAFLGQSPRFQAGQPPERQRKRRPADRHDEANEPVAAGHGG